ncbi:hypothetical protein G8B50_08110 [Enterococcus durans]|uniref:hypothetical protein n=1 Tax=Enterococcus durans TaxID=53345 RepID=UPI00188356CF|nr:hypothetical protein [Enterococcus durans]MBE9887634.1 hypothetical protein [Enterococcus durans]
MSRTKKNIVIVVIGIIVYLFTSYVYRHVSLFAEPLFHLNESDSAIIRSFANFAAALLFTPALRIITIIICLFLLFIVNKKKK